VIVAFHFLLRPYITLCSGLEQRATVLLFFVPDLHDTPPLIVGCTGNLSLWCHDGVARVLQESYFLQRCGCDPSKS